MIPFHLWQGLEKRFKRFPEFYSTDLSKVFVQTLAQMSDRFLETRSDAFIQRFVLLSYFVRAKLMQKMQNSSQRCVVVKPFKLKVEGKSVLSIALGISTLHVHELLEEKHVFKALSNLMPGIKIAFGSFYSCKEKESGHLFCYLEIEKLRGNHFTMLEVNLLKKNLPNELKQGIQFLTPSISIPYNQEEIYKSLIQLSQEQRVIADLPQVMISFHSQIQEVLQFNVVATRVQKKDSIPFKKLAAHLPSSVRLVSQRMVALGVLGKRVREGLIFLLEVDYDFFLKKNWSIDLRQARNYIAKAVEQILGPFRDYNGGLLSQQDKQFEEILFKFREKFATFHPFMEEVFYSLTPPSFQTLISARTCLQVFALFSRLYKKELGKTHFLIESRYASKDAVLIIKTADSQLQGSLLPEMLEIQSSNHSCFGYSTIEFEGAHYLFLIDVNPSLGLLHACERKLRGQRNRPEVKNEAKVLRINFQEGDPISLNPQIGIDQRCRSLGRALYEGLTRLDAQGVPQLAAAREIHISASQTEYTFFLREHQWSNGDMVTAYDFEQTWKKALNSNSPYLRADFFYPIKNARKAKQGLISLNKVKVKAAGPQKLLVELQHPASYFLHLTAHPALSPLYKGEEEPTQFNGPFLVRQWQKDQLLHLTANPYYWDKKNVALDDVYITMHKDFKTIYEDFQKEKLDWIGDPYCVLPQEYHTDVPLWRSREVDQVSWVYLNTRVFPLQSASIRKAFACAIDRKIITKTLGQYPHMSPIPQSQCDGFESWDGNAAQAQAFFAAGLKELGIKKNEFPELTFYHSDIPGQEYLVKRIQEQLRQVLDVSIRLVRMEWNSLSLHLDRREFQLAACLRSSPYFYPRSHLELFRDRTNLYNSSQWEHPEYTALLKSAHAAKESQARDRLLKQAEEILIQEMPVIGIFRHVYKYRVNTKIKNVCIAQNGDVDLKLISF